MEPKVNCLLFEDKTVREPCPKCYTELVVWDVPEAWPVECNRCGTMVRKGDAKRYFEAWRRAERQRIPVEVRLTGIEDTLAEITRLLKEQSDV